MNNVLLCPIELEELFDGFRSIVREEIRAEQNKQLHEKLLSPAEVCKLFQPTISRVTLSAWTKQNLLQEHRIGGRIYYKMSEVLEAGKTLKKYKRPLLPERNSIEHVSNKNWR